jgi:flagellar biosynthesis GTPase FlhF
MTVYVDDMYLYPIGRFKHMKMSHMIGDDENELHEMARRIGVQRKWYQGDHYDIAMSKRVLALTFGAQPISYKLCGLMNSVRRATGKLPKPEDAERIFFQLYEEKGNMATELHQVEHPDHGQVEAFQWNADDPDKKLPNWLPPNLRNQVGRVLEVFTRDGTVFADHGHFIGRNGFGNIFVMAEHAFRDTFNFQGGEQIQPRPEGDQRNEQERMADEQNRAAEQARRDQEQQRQRGETAGGTTTTARPGEAGQSDEDKRLAEEQYRRQQEEQAQREEEQRAQAEANNQANQANQTNQTAAEAQVEEQPNEGALRQAEQGGTEQQDQAATQGNKPGNAFARAIRNKNQEEVDRVSNR